MCINLNCFEKNNTKLFMVLKICTKYNLNSEKMISLLQISTGRYYQD